MKNPPAVETKDDTNENMMVMKWDQAPIDHIPPNAPVLSEEQMILHGRHKTNRFYRSARSGCGGVSMNPVGLGKVLRRIFSKIVSRALVSAGHHARIEAVIHAMR